MRKKSKKIPYRMVALISQLGITMMVALFMCAGIGYLISEKTGNELWFLLFLLLGMLAGFRSCYDIIRRFVDLSSSVEKTESSESGKTEEESE